LTLFRACCFRQAADAVIANSGFILPVLVNESFFLEGEMMKSSTRNVSLTTLLFTLLLVATGFAALAHRNSVPPQLACHNTQARQNNSACAQNAKQTNDCAGELGLRQLAPDL
jgi:hypothetical protein